jgi:RHS repeat-associated protein
MEKDDEVSGSGNSLDFGARMYDSRLGRWLARDPKTGRLPSFSPYMFVNNDPIRYIDPDGAFLIDVHRRIVMSAFQRSKLGRVFKTVIENGVSKQILLLSQNIADYRLAMYGYSDLNSAVTLPDVMVMQGAKSVDAAHFDNMNYTQIVDNFNSINIGMQNVLGSFKSGDITAKELGEINGYYYHAVADFYSHSNYVELWKEYNNGKETDASLIPLFDVALSDEKYSGFKELLVKKLKTGEYPGTGKGAHKHMNHDKGKGTNAAYAQLPEVADQKVNWNTVTAEELATRATTVINDKVEAVLK